MSFVTHLECALCGTRHDPNSLQNLCTSCQRPLWVKYDLAAIGKSFSKAALKDRPATIWRYREFLPIKQDPISLGETMTPILETRKLAVHFGMPNLWVKDESRLPTGSFKARGMVMAISKANEFGVKRVACPTAGNAGGAMAAYAARAGMEAYVFMPEDTPSINQKECYLAGAKTFLVNGLITDCGRIVGEGKAKKGWFDVSTLKEPYRIEGKKTMGLELAEQFDWELPDVILYPTGGGTGLIGMWKAFAELETLGWLKSSKKPRMISCQSDGCAPIAIAFEQGERFAKKFENAKTVASGIRVPAAVGDFMILDAVRESGGVALALPEADIPKWMQLAASTEGIALCPETAVCLGALEKLLAEVKIKPHERVLIFNTGASQKYPEAVQEKLPRIDITKPIEWEAIFNMDILITEDLVSPAINSLVSKYSVIAEPNLWQESRRLKAKISKARTLMIRNQTKLTRELLQMAPKLQAVGRVGVGLDNIDLQAANDLGIVVIAPLDANAVSVAEFTLGLILSLARKILPADQSTRSGEWNRRRYTGFELEGKTLSVIGFGRIGKLVTARAKAFGLRTVVYDPFVKAPDGVSDLDEALRQADFLSVHVPLTDKTRGLIDASAFAKIKPGAFVINTSRGGIIDEDALLVELKRKAIAGAALDVRETEPPTGRNPFKKFNNVILTPHIASFTVEAQTRTFEAVCSDLDRILRGEPAHSFVNFAQPKK